MIYPVKRCQNTITSLYSLCCQRNSQFRTLGLSETVFLYFFDKFVLSLQQFTSITFTCQTTVGNCRKKFKYLIILTTKQKACGTDIYHRFIDYCTISNFHWIRYQKTGGKGSPNNHRINTVTLVWG